MNRMPTLFGSARLGFGLVAIFLTALAAPVRADNCGSLTDCFSTIPPAVLAVGAIAIFILLLAFLPAILTALQAGLSWVMTGEFVAGTAARMAAVDAWGAAAMTEAEIAAGIEAAIARAEAAELLGALARGANPLGGGLNCQACASVIRANLAGDVGAVAPYANTLLSNAGIAEAAGGSLGLPTTGAAIDATMAGAASGSEGFVIVSNGAYSHIFNTVNVAGEAFFVDGQIGVVGSSAAEVAAASGYTGDLSYVLISFF